VLNPDRSTFLTFTGEKNTLLQVPLGALLLMGKSPFSIIIEVFTIFTEAL
jgi:hypothetical protein